MTADALSQEKRGGTLGLLFLTDLRGYDVVVGKLAASSVHAFFGLLAVAPIMGLPVLIGGVEFRTFLLIFTALVTTLFFSLSAGLLVSAFCKRVHFVIIGTFLVVLFFNLGPGVALLILRELFDFRSAPDWLWTLGSPIGCIAYAFELLYGSGNVSSHYWWSEAQVLALSCVFLGLASWHLPRSWQEKGLLSQRQKTRVGLLGRLASWIRNHFKRPALGDGDPFIWLASRNTMERMLAWAAAALMGVAMADLLACAFVPRFKNSGFLILVMFCCGFGSHILLKFLVAVKAARQLGEDRASGALELLLSTPVKDEDILRGYRAGAIRQFRVPAICILLGNAALTYMINSFCYTFSANKTEVAWFSGLFCLGMLLILLDCWALWWLGLWRGMRAKTANRAMMGTLTFVLGIPWMALPIFYILDSSSHMLPPYWCVAVVLLSIVLAILAKAQLARGIRQKLNQLS